MLAHSGELSLFWSLYDINIERQTETDITEQNIKIESTYSLSQINEYVSQIRQMVVEEQIEPKQYQKQLCNELNNYIALLQANSHIQRSLQKILVKIKSLNKIENIEDILKRREQYK
ncbi:Hypothetical_protein [Hexamita inflata]|uniref:Hypothetical_protein n=1 Tax=Hexamita inflata TaxID=28002 RepID=A0AA86RAS5_9EUKA|nr:Hypothetical protein HINF_LOCUS58828 [Hexamita inflata]